MHWWWHWCGNSNSDTTAMVAVAAMATAMVVKETMTAVVAAIATVMVAIKKRLKENTLHRRHPTNINISAQPPLAPPIFRLFCCCHCRLFYCCRARTQMEGGRRVLIFD